MRFHGRFDHRSILIVLILLSLLLGLPMAEAKPETILEFSHDLQEAREAAAATDRPIVIFFGGAWCPICRQMREETLQSPKLRPWSEKMVWVEIDLDRKLSLARDYEIRAVPTLIVENPKGEEIRRVVGRLDADEFVALLENIDRAPASVDVGKGPEGASSAILWDREGYRAGSICFANVGYGPLRLRSQSGFQALRLMMIPRAPSTLAKGSWEAHGSLVWSNLWAVEEKSFHPDQGQLGPYLIDAETLEGDLSLSYGLSDTFEFEVGYEMRSHFGGILDGVIEGFHDLIGAGQQGRDRWPRNQFHFIWAPEGREETSLGPGDSGVFVQNLLLTVQHNLSCGSEIWPAVSWWATARLALQSDGFEGRPIDGILGVALAKRIGDFNAYLSLSHAWYSENIALGVIELKTTQVSTMASLEWRFHPRTSLNLQYLLSGGVVKHVAPFDETSKEIIIGMKHEVSDLSVLEWGIIENLAPFENSPDVGLYIGYTRRF